MLIILKLLIVNKIRDSLLDFTTGKLAQSKQLGPQELTSFQDWAWETLNPNRKFTVCSHVAMPEKTTSIIVETMENEPDTTRT